MKDRFLEAIRTIQEDHSSGATALLTRAVRVLREAAAEGRATLDAVAGAVTQAQPCMAGLRNAARVARTADDPGLELARFAQRVTRAPEAIARHAAALLALRAPGAAGPLRLVTLSASAAVEATIVHLAGRQPVAIDWAESRPGLEGRAAAGRLATQGLRVRVFTDGGLSSAIRGADAVVVGADALAPRAFVNKVGTGAVCAYAAAMGVPVYVLAGREKVIGDDELDQLPLPGGPADEVWAEAPRQILVENPYFERVPSDWSSLAVTAQGAVPWCSLLGTF
jgi:translation initiation factor 2B subunit (eIF-2B alpha/beta/delta family)